MGAVQKLATIVVVGLTALATLLVVYVANEGNRTGAEATEQQDVAIERGIQTFILQCVACHGPGGAGLFGGDDPARIGFPLNPEADPLGPDPTNEDDELTWRDNQSELELVHQQRYDLFVETLQNGRGNMPAFGRGAEGGALLNDEQIHELATMIGYVDWDRVYNETIENTAGVYPTAPPPAAPAAAQAGGQGSGDAGPEEGQQPTVAGTPAAGGDQAAAPTGATITIEGYDIGWRFNGQQTAVGTPFDVPVAAGDTISSPNVGASLHNFSVDPWSVSEDMPVGATVTVNVPGDAQPGPVEFYCNVAGHRAAGMVGNLVVQ